MFELEPEKRALLGLEQAFQTPKTLWCFDPQSQLNSWFINTSNSKIEFVDN